MGRTERLALIEELQKRRKSNVICYVTGDRRNLVTPIASDVVRLIYNHLLLHSEAKRIDLFLYSIGGHGDAPWKIVPMLREFCEELCVLIPYKAYSAATLVAIGTDSILMGRKAELGPIDPSMTTSFHPEDPYVKPKRPLEIGVEDITAFLNLFKDDLKIKNKKLVAESFRLLADKVGPLALGRLHRTLLHNRLLIKKLLRNRMNPPPDRQIDEVTKNLTERIFFHGHAINRKEAATDIGLDNIVIPDKETENIMWQLFLEYEKELLLDEPFEPEMILEQRNTDEFAENDLKVAFIESLNLTHICNMDMRLQRIRRMPTNLQLNINIVFPPGIDPANIPQPVMAAIHSQLQRSVVDQIRLQSEVIAVKATMIKGGWKTET